MRARSHGPAARARPAAVLLVLALGAVLGLAEVVAAPAPAAAHNEIPGYRHVVDAVEPEVPGVDVSVVVSAAAQLVVRNPTTTVLEVMGEGGEPFLRISATGVQANLSSPDWYRSATPEGDGRVPSGIDRDSPPRWATVASEPTWAWFDHRLHAARADAAPETSTAARPGRAIVLGSWLVPMRYGGRDVEVRGHREFLRPSGTFRTQLVGGVEGLRAGVVDGTVPAISVAVPAGRSLVVFGEAGEPMARVGPGGVEGNAASPTWRLTAASRGAVPTGAVGADQPPRWEPAGGGTTLTWLEPRARDDRLQPPRRQQVVRRWSVPVELDGRAATLTGTTSWVPEGPSGSAPGRAADDSWRPELVVILLAAGGAAGVALLAVRRRLRPVAPRGGRRGR